MRSLSKVALAIALAAGTARAQPAPDPPPAPVRPSPYDQVGQAVIMPEGAPAAAHATLPPGSYAEVTAIDTGRTALVAIAATARPGRGLELSPAAAQELGLGPGKAAPVRVRAATATTEDLAVFRTGQAAVARPDAPPVLLTALRRKLKGLPPPGPAAAVPVAKSVGAASRTAAPKPSMSTPTSSPPQARSGPGYYVQIAALSDPARAAAVARSVSGQVSTTGRLHRVRLGPYPDQRGAQAARDAVAGRGYGDARIVRE